MKKSESRDRSLLQAVNPKTVNVGFHKAESTWLSAWKTGVLPDFDIWYVATGGGEVMVDGRWIPFRAGDVVILKPGSRYERERADPQHPFEMYYAHLHPFGDCRPHLERRLAADWPPCLSLLHRPEIAVIFREYHDTFVISGDSEPLRLRGLALQLLSVIVQETRRPVTAPVPQSSAAVLRARRFMERHHADDVRLSSVAAHVGLSPSHLSALFRTHTRTSPIEFLIRVRIRKAQLLLARGAPVKEAAYSTGFTSQHYFCRLFKLRVGMTPTAYARRHARP